MSNIKDNEKQEAIDMFLGNIEEDIEIWMSPADKWIQSQLKFRESQYTTLVSKRIYIGTYYIYTLFSFRFACLSF